MPENRHTEPLVPETEDSRRICFEQGKPCVYQPDDEPGTIMTEWPNGVIDRWWLESDTRRRHWPDGTTENAPADRPPYADPQLEEPTKGRPMPRLIIVIGANGAGKTTWCRRHGELLPEHFYNADTIAEGLGGWNSPAHQRAARDLIDKQVESHLTHKEDFGFESTYSGRSRPAIIERAGALGYCTTAIFLGTLRPEINIQRVAARVATRTGHQVPTAEIRRRWAACPANLAHTAHAVHCIHMLDNSGPTTRRVSLIQNGRETARTATMPEWARELSGRIRIALARTAPITRG